jgi:hypothetical protein
VRTGERAPHMTEYFAFKQRFDAEHLPSQRSAVARVQIARASNLCRPSRLMRYRHWRCRFSLQQRLILGCT